MIGWILFQTKTLFMRMRGISRVSPLAVVALSSLAWIARIPGTVLLPGSVLRRAILSRVGSGRVGSCSGAVAARRLLLPSPALDRRDAARVLLALVQARHLLQHLLNLFLCLLQGRDIFTKILEELCLALGEQQFVLVRHALGLDCFVKQVGDVLNIKWHRVKEEVELLQVELGVGGLLVHRGLKNFRSLLAIVEREPEEPAVLDGEVGGGGSLGGLDGSFVELASLFDLPATPLQVDPLQENVDQTRVGNLKLFEDPGGFPCLSHLLLPGGPPGVQLHLGGQVLMARSLEHSSDPRLPLTFVQVRPTLPPVDIVKPELFVKRASDETALVDDLHLRQVSPFLRHLHLHEVQIVLPVLQLSALEWFHMEVGTFDPLLILPAQLRPRLCLAEDRLQLNYHLGSDGFVLLLAGHGSGVVFTRNGLSS